MWPMAMAAIICSRAGMAVLATAGSLKRADAVRTAAVKRRAQEQSDMEAVAQVIGGQVLHFQVRTGEKGKLYGSITAGNIAEKLTQILGKEFDKRKVALREPIRDIGTHAGHHPPDRRDHPHSECDYHAGRRGRAGRCSCSRGRPRSRNVRPKPPWQRLQLPMRQPRVRRNKRWRDPMTYKCCGAGGRMAAGAPQHFCFELQVALALLRARSGRLPPVLCGSTLVQAW